MTTLTTKSIKDYPRIKYQYRTKWMGVWTEWMDCHISVWQDAKVLKDKCLEARKIVIE